MSWNDTDLTKVSITIEPVALGEYTFSLDPGPKLEADGRLTASATIVDGTFSGRRMFFSYPNPERQDWAERVMKRLTAALGVEQDKENGETVLQVLQKSAGLRFAAPVVEGKKSEDYPTPRNQIDIFKIKAAA